MNHISRNMKQNTDSEAVNNSLDTPSKCKGTSGDNDTIHMQSSTHDVVPVVSVDNGDMSFFSFCRATGSNVWILMLVELVERIAYYGTAFSLTTYCTNLINFSMSLTNVLVNILYVVSPLSACVGGALSDGALGRPKTLLVGCFVYATGLAIVAISAMPFNFAHFPNEPHESITRPLIFIGVVFFGIGYGLMKVSLPPLLADCTLINNQKCCSGECCSSRHATCSPIYFNSSKSGCCGTKTTNQVKSASSHYDADSSVISKVNEREYEGGGCTCGCQEGLPCTCYTVTPTCTAFGLGLAIRGSFAWRVSYGGLEDSPAKPLLAGEDRPSQCNSTVDAVPELTPSQATNCIYHEQDELDQSATAPEAAILSRLFRFQYFVINLGSIIGIIGAPFARKLGYTDKLKEKSENTGKLVDVGYFIPFWICTASMILGGLLFLLNLKKFPGNRVMIKTMVVFLTLKECVKNWWWLMSRDSSTDVIHENAYVRESIFATHMYSVTDDLTLESTYQKKQFDENLTVGEREKYIKTLIPFRNFYAAQYAVESPTSFSRCRIATQPCCSLCLCRDVLISSSIITRKTFLTVKPICCSHCVMTVVRGFQCNILDRKYDIMGKYGGPSFLCYALLEEYVFQQLIILETAEGVEYVSGRKYVDDSHYKITPAGVSRSTRTMTDYKESSVRNDFSDMDPTQSGTPSSPNSASPDQELFSSYITFEDVQSLGITLSLCVVFIALPVYWLLSIQFSSNVILQMDWMNMPSGLPPEVFNSLDTITILVTVPLMDYIVTSLAVERFYRRLYTIFCASEQKNVQNEEEMEMNGNSNVAKTRPSVILRLVSGFILMFVAMLLVTVIQIIIVTRGEFMNDSPAPNMNKTHSDDRVSVSAKTYYRLYPGKMLLSAAWLIIPYILKGVSEVLVDTTTIEVAYTAAPSNMKSTVMSLYLIASSISGFLGLIYSPFVSGTNMMIVMLSLCLIQLSMIVVFVWVTRPEKVKNSKTKAFQMEKVIL